MKFSNNNDSDRIDLTPVTVKHKIQIERQPGDNGDPNKPRFKDVFENKFVINLIKFDNVGDNLKVLSQVVEHVKHTHNELGIKFRLDENGRVKHFRPSDVHCYVDKKLRMDGGKVVFCDINNFERFYVHNLRNILSEKNINIHNIDDDGWTTLSTKADTKNRLGEALNEVRKYCMNWNQIDSDKVPEEVLETRETPIEQIESQ